MSYNPNSGARLLGGVNYDPSTAATAATTSLLAMTALDTTNIRVAITAPTSGKVTWKARLGVLFPATCPTVLLGVLDGATVRARAIGETVWSAVTAAHISSITADGIITGLTPGNAYNLDLAYGVEEVVASSNIGWGGPNNTTADDAYGGAVFKIYEVLA